MLEFFLVLMFVHFLFDFCLQTSFISEYKQKVPFVMFVHVFVWTFAICAVVNYFTVLSLYTVVFLFAGHWFSDWYKCYLIKKELLKDTENDRKRLLFLFHCDQVWHLIQLVLVAWLTL